jgi:MSHA biogenesis protein MshM
VLAREGKRVVLCVDEAQAIPIESLEALRLLTNLETEKRKLLQIVLFGQPELDENLRLESIRQLAQRITFHYHLGPLSAADFDTYLEHRLRVAGYRGKRIFTRTAVRRLYSASAGVPRLANILAHKALMVAYGRGSKEVGAAEIRMAVRDTATSRKPLWQWLRLPLTAAAAASCAFGAAWILLK